MSEAALTHFKVSGRDLFDTPDVKLLLAHLSVLSNEHNSIAWTRIMKGVRAFPSHALARRFNWKLKQLALTPPTSFSTPKAVTRQSFFVPTTRTKSLYSILRQRA